MRRAAAIELGLFTLLVLAQVWRVWDWFNLAKSTQRSVRVLLVVAAGAVLLASWLRVRDAPADLGLTAGAMRRGWGEALAATLLLLLPIVAMALVLNTVSAGGDRLRWAAKYLPGLIGQQVLLQCFVNQRCWLGLDRLAEPKRTRASVLLAAGIFTLLHAPNPGLMACVAVSSLVWCLHFRRYQNLAAVMLSHAVLGTAAMLLLGDGPLLRLRVGPGAWDLLMGR